MLDVFFPHWTDDYWCIWQEDTINAWRLEQRIMEELRLLNFDLHHITVQLCRQVVSLITARKPQAGANSTLRGLPAFHPLSCHYLHSAAASSIAALQPAAPPACSCHRYTIRTKLGCRSSLGSSSRTETVFSADKDPWCFYSSCCDAEKNIILMPMEDKKWQI